MPKPTKKTSAAKRALSKRTQVAGASTKELEYKAEFYQIAQENSLNIEEPGDLRLTTTLWNKRYNAGKDPKTATKKGSNWVWHYNDNYTPDSTGDRWARNKDGYVQFRASKAGRLKKLLDASDQPVTTAAAAKTAADAIIEECQYTIESLEELKAEIE